MKQRASGLNSERKQYSWMAMASLRSIMLPIKATIVQECLRSGTTTGLDCVLGLQSNQVSVGCVGQTRLILITYRGPASSATVAGFHLSGGVCESAR